MISLRSKSVLFILMLIMSLPIGGSFALGKEELRIGVVDSQELLALYSEHIDINRILDEEFKEKDRVLIEKRKEVIEKRNEIESERSKIFASETLENSNIIRDLEREIRNLERDFARLSDEYLQEYNLRKNEELYKIQRQINDAILAYADNHGYDLIIESVMVYSKEELNLNQKILAELVERIEK